MKLKSILVKDGAEEFWYTTDKAESKKYSIHVKSITCETHYKKIDWKSGFVIDFGTHVIEINPIYVWSASWNTEK